MPSAGEEAEQLDVPHVAGGNAKWYSHSGNLFCSFLGFF